MIELSRTAIIVNGETRTLIPDTIADLVEEISGRSLNRDGSAADGARLGIAVAQNAGIVPRSQWAATPLLPGDAIEIVTAAQGG